MKLSKTELAKIQEEANEMMRLEVASKQGISSEELSKVLLRLLAIAESKLLTKEDKLAKMANVIVRTGAMKVYIKR